MASVNKAILWGRLGKDPELRSVNGQEVCKFTMATSESYMKDGNKFESTEWHNITVWGKIAGACAKYLRKGSGAYVEGKLKTSKYEKDGVTRYNTEIIAFNVIFTDSKSDAKKESTPAQTNFPPSNHPEYGSFDEGPIDYSNIPF